MAFREKLAWSSLVAMIVAYGAYFVLAAPLIARGDATLPAFAWLIGGVLAAQCLVEIVARIAVAIHAGREALAAADERDRAIARRGAAHAYFLLVIGMLLVGCALPFVEAGPLLLNAALFALFVAEATRYGTIVHSYRRGWHG